MPAELKPYIELKQVQLEHVVRHLKLMTRCFEANAIKQEWYDYLTGKSLSLKIKLELLFRPIFFFGNLFSFCAYFIQSVLLFFVKQKL